MTLRASLEAVLERHGVCVCGEHNYVVLKKRDAVSHYEGLLDDLLACVPQPSRETLKMRLQYLWGSVFEKQEEALDIILFWATGQRERVWCEHMDYDTGHWTMKDRSWSIPSGMTWQYCPLCAAPRPGEW